MNTIPTQIELESAFKVYFDEMKKCEKNKCYWALLHLIVIMPDICCALESQTGDTNGNRFKGWCKRFLADQTIADDEWYEIRNILLHQGRTIPRKGRYKSFSFIQPAANGAIVHRIHDFSKADLQLDVGQLKNEVEAAMRKWFHEIAERLDPKRSTNVHRNLSFLARAQNSSTGFLRGIEFMLHRSDTIAGRTASPRH